MKKVFAPVTKASEATTKAVELKGDETTQTTQEMEGTTNSIVDMIKIASHPENWLITDLSEHFDFLNKDHFRLELNPNSLKNFTFGLKLCLF